MRILVIHNRYTQAGGEDTVVDAELAALRARGHEVHLHEAVNEEPGTGGDGATDANGSAALGGKFGAARRAIWNREAARELARVVAEVQPDVAHVHNHAWTLSPAIYPVLDDAGVPIVATLHNYRLTCSNAYLLREGRPCEDCVGARASWHGVQHACFRDSRSASAMVAGMQLAWRRAALPTVSRWIALTHFARDIHERAGVPSERLVVRPNTIAAPKSASSARTADAPLLFVGRLEESKGIDVLLEAWGDGIGAHRLLVAGDGPLLPALRARAPMSVELLGQVPRERVAELIAAARALVVPSTWYEGFPMVVLEAMAAGTPVLASRIGSLAEIVDAPHAGWHAEPGDARSLRAGLDAVLADAADAEQRGATARATFDARYAQEPVMAQLEQLYADAISDRRRRAGQS